MQTNFSLFRERLAEACRARKMTHIELFRSVGIGGRRVVYFHSHGIKALDLYRVCQIADALNVSVDWLLGRSDAMELPTCGAD
jgi:hypothetical protein